MIKGHCESQGVIIGSLLSPQAILVVGNSVPTTDPADTLGSLNARILKWPHALIVHRRRLHHVDDIEAILRTPAGVAHPEKVPLRV